MRSARDSRPTTIAGFDVGTGEADTIGAGDRTGQSILHVVTQLRVQSQLARSRSLCRTIGMPLRSAGTIVENTASSGTVTLQLPRDSAWRAIELARNGADPSASGHLDRDVLAFRKCNEATCREPRRQ
jgi:hypothetical protein